MKYLKQGLIAIVAIIALISCATSSGGAAAAGASTTADVDNRPLLLNIASVNDIHSKFEPTQYKLVYDIDPTLKQKSVYVELGGLPRLAAAIKTVRGWDPNTLVLEGGDIFQGTLYFTKYAGIADTQMWNLIAPDAMVLGNHEFDKGPATLNSNLLQLANFPILSANLDYSKEGAIPKGKIASYVIKEVGGTRVGIVGITTEETPFISSPGAKLAFTPRVKAAQAAIDELSAKGVNKIIILTHEGYAEDIELASQITGADVIVGSHSHTLLGDFSSFGLSSSGPYPTQAKDKVGNSVLVVQSWEWAKVLGYLSVAFDATGKVTSFSGSPYLLTGRDWFRIYDIPNKAGENKRVQFSFDSSRKLSIAEFDGKDFTISVIDDPSVNDDQFDLYKATLDKAIKALDANPNVLFSANDPKAQALADGYAADVKALKAQKVCEASEDLKRGFDKGPGPIIADAMRAKTGARIGMTNSGGVRIDINEGPISVATIYELIPFGNTLVTMKVTGAELVQTIEEALDYSISKYGADTATNAFFYISGIKLSLNLSKAKGERVVGIQVLKDDGSYENLDPKASYSLVVNNFMAAGGDHYDTLKTVKGTDTGFIDAEALMEYAQGKVFKNTESRISIVK